LGYTCPHYIETGNASEATDIYALGIILIELITGKKPVSTQSGRPIYLGKYFREFVKNGEPILNIFDPMLELKLFTDKHQELIDLVNKCVDTLPQNRPTASEIEKKFDKILSNEKGPIQRVCVVCFEAPTNARLQCGHAAFCHPCALSMQKRGSGCPFCRAAIVDIVQGEFLKTFVESV